jgi:hypothetical protein
MPWVWLAAAILANAAVVLVVRPLDRLRGWSRLFAWLMLGGLTSLVPAFVPMSDKPLRFVASLVTITTLVKLYDVYRTPGFRSELSLSSHLAYFTNGFWHVLKRPPESVRPEQDWRRLTRGLPLTTLAIVVTIGIFHIDWRPLSVLFEHVAKVTAVVLATVLLVNLLSAVWRLAGSRGHVPMGDVVRASTPAEFWHRWNTPTQQFLLAHVYIPAGGRRHPIRGILATFLISGLIHEYVVGIAAGRVLGLQMLFFVLQGLGVIASGRWRSASRSLPVASGLTLAFNLVTAAVFFASLNMAIPFYAAR